MHNFIYCGDCQSQKSLSTALQNAPDATAILGDHAALWDFEIAANLYTLPLAFLISINLFTEDDCRNTDITKVFNFMVNKKTDHRYLTMRLIEYFNLSEYSYTYSGSAINIDDTQIFRDLDRCDPKRQLFSTDTMGQILGDVTIAPCFLRSDGSDYLDESLQTGAVSGYGGNYHSWKIGLDQIFNSTLISLVTESDNGDYDKVTVFTEKTVYAVMGLTMPIWVGGYRHADMFEDMGFDIFSDLIDHSYQYQDTMFMRCWRAVNDNLGMLRDLAKAKQLLANVMPRLIHNRELLFSENLVNWYHARMQNWPIEIKRAVRKRLKILDHGRDIDQWPRS